MGLRADGLHPLPILKKQGDSGTGFQPVKGSPFFIRSTLARTQNSSLPQLFDPDPDEADHLPFGVGPAVQKGHQQFHGLEAQGAR